MALSLQWPPARRPPAWLRVGRCRVCGTSVLVDDDFVRVGRAVRHAECDRFLRERRRGAAAGERIATSVRGGVDAGAEAREVLLACRPGLQASPGAELELLVTELVTNAVRHGGADRRHQIGLVIESSGATLRVAVTDPGPGFDWEGRPSDRRPSEGGFGLVLVDRLSRSWGIEREAASTTVWFELERA